MAPKMKHAKGDMGKYLFLFERGHKLFYKFKKPQENMLAYFLHIKIGNIQFKGNKCILDQKFPRKRSN